MPWVKELSMKIIYEKQLRFEPALCTVGGRRRIYFLCERNSGAAQCLVTAGPGTTFPLVEASSLLAMQCLARGRLPKDYVVMALTNENELKGLFEKTEKLLQTTPSIERPVKLTRREQQVLTGLLRALANKEIAAALNVRVRTVKFHVSSLLSKFHVRGRMELVHEVTRGMAGLLGMPTAATNNRSDGGED
jgi:DNA-binding CsgD family transcriptional regulator